MRMLIYIMLKRTQHFLMLPHIFFDSIKKKECYKSKLNIIIDLLYIFFKLRFSPLIYQEIRLWEVNRSDFKYYYGDPNFLYARIRFRETVQNRAFQPIFDNKYVTDIYLRSLTDSLPKFYGVIEPHQYCESYFKKLFIEKSLNRVILKPIEGYRGQGVNILEENNGTFIIRTGKSNLNFSDFHIKDSTMIQQFICQHKQIAEIYPHSLNTIRMHTLLTHSNDIMIPGAYIRFGRSGSIVDNVGAGGLGVNIDVKTGKLGMVAYDDIPDKYYEHPDTKFEFNNFQIPYWNEILRLAKQIQKATIFYKLLGLDIAITSEGPVLVEVNANPEMGYQELFSSPLLRDKRILKEFATYDLLYNKAQRKLLSAIN